MKLDRIRYEQAVKREIDKVLFNLEREIYARLIAKLSRITLRQVDKNFRGEMKSSVETEIKAIRKRTILNIGAAKMGGNSMKTQSFRALYYEYGTGTKMKPPDYFNPSKDKLWNPSRPVAIKSPIYTRKKGEVYYDLGGNERVSKAKGEPRAFYFITVSKGVKEPVEISARGWFSSALKDCLIDIEKKLIDAINKVNILDFVLYNKQIVIK